MKGDTYWFFLIGFVSFFLLCWPVQGDITNPTITHVFFEKDGKPFNDTVQFTVNCTGHRIFPWIGTAEERANASSTPAEIIYSYSASCAQYGCTVYEPYYLNYRDIDSCDLEGVAAGEHFIIRNFADTPLPQDCTDLNPFTMMKSPKAQNPDYYECMNASEPLFSRCVRLMAPCKYPVESGNCSVYDDKTLEDTPESLACNREAANASRTCNRLRYPNEIYNVTPAYDQCMNASYVEYDNCYQYLDECSPTRDEDCGNWISDGRYVKKSIKWQDCTDKVHKQQEDCDQYLARVDPANLVMWIDPQSGREAGEVRRECTARFTIPTDTASPGVFTGDDGMPKPSKSPIESLYCIIVGMLGGRCE